MEKYMNAALPAETRAQLLLAEMSVEEKLAQANCLFAIPGKEAEAKDSIPFGIGQVSTLEMRRLESLEACGEWQRKLQSMVMENSPHHIPAIFHMEGLCGAYIHSATSFPSGIGRGASFDPELEKRVAETVSRQERAVGVTQIFAPVLDVSRDSRMGRQGECYGEDPALCAAMGAAYTAGIQEGETDGRHAESTAKHFLGSHHTQGGIHGADAEIPERLLREVYAKPFQAAITESHLRGIMPCYCSINGTAVSTSKEIIGDLLRDEMGFDGVAMSDYSALSNAHRVQHQFESLAETGLAGMTAGMDVEEPLPATFNDELCEWFKTGKADIAVLDRAVYRTLCAKFRMGLFEHPFAMNGEALESAFHRAEDGEITLRSARESMTLLKNEGALPIAKDARKIAVVGCHAVNPRFFFAGYTHLSMNEAILVAEGSMAGVTQEALNKAYPRVPGTQIQSDETEEFEALRRQMIPDCPSLLDELKRRLPETQIEWAYGYPVAGADDSHYAEALETMRGADLILFTLGGKYTSGSISTDGEGVDGVNINLPPCQDGLIREAAKLGIPMIGVHFDGRPVSSDAADEYLNALLEAWNPGERGAEAVVDALLGDVNPAGRVPVCVARMAGQIPVYYNHPNGCCWHQGESIGFVNYVDCPHEPRYFFGHGMSYTRFEYGDLQLSQHEIGARDSVEISFTLKNVGGCDGDEVAQLYVIDRYASRVRPVKELAGFCRVHLRAGERKRVRFILRADQLAFLDGKMQWLVERGDFDVQIGASSEDIRLTDSYKVTESAIIEPRNRGFYATALIEEV